MTDFSTLRFLSGDAPLMQPLAPQECAKYLFETMSEYSRRGFLKPYLDGYDMDHPDNAELNDAFCSIDEAEYSCAGLEARAIFSDYHPLDGEKRLSLYVSRRLSGSEWPVWYWVVSYTEKALLNRGIAQFSILRPDRDDERFGALIDTLRLSNPEVFVRNVLSSFRHHATRHADEYIRTARVLKSLASDVDIRTARFNALAQKRRISSVVDHPALS